MTAINKLLERNSKLGNWCPATAPPPALPYT